MSTDATSYSYESPESIEYDKARDYPAESQERDEVYAGEVVGGIIVHGVIHAVVEGLIHALFFHH